MANQTKPRLIFSVFALGGLVFTVFNWYLLVSDGSFYPKGALIGPGVTPFFAVLAIFPQIGQAPQPVAVKWRIAMLGALALGVALGLYNYSLMNNYRPH